jgi:uncharacterized protein with von Willebrand factor type A (vWA) domain
VEVGVDQVLEQLRSEDRRRQELEQHQAQLVAQARELGASWAQLGRVLGRTGQAVSMRYGPAAGGT